MTLPPKVIDFDRQTHRLWLANSMLLICEGNGVLFHVPSEKNVESRITQFNSLLGEGWNVATANFSTVYAVVSRSCFGLLNNPHLFHFLQQHIRHSHETKICKVNAVDRCFAIIADEVVAADVI